MINNRWKVNLSFKLAFIILITSLFGISLIAYVSYIQSKDIFAEKSVSTIQRDLSKYSKDIVDRTNSLSQDVAMLSQNRSINGFLRAYHNPYQYDEVQNKTLSEFKKEIKSLFKLMLKQNSSYFQIRVLDASTGKELVRLDKNNGKILVMPENKLQNKQKRLYTQGALKAKGKIYTSKINLNRELNLIEFPIKPTIRIAQMTSTNTKKAGIIVINVDASKLLKFNKSRRSKIIKTYIANQEGYYLLNTTEPFKEFGFEFNKEYKVYDDFPKLKKLLTTNLKHYSINNNSFILESKKVYLSSNRYLLVIKHTTDSLFNKRENEYFLKLLTYILVIAVLIAIITIVVVRKFTYPIKKLKKIAEEIALSKGEKVIKIDIDSKDEVGDLAQSFSIMLETIQESKQDIKDFATRLEIEVDKKTKELKKLNESLQKNVDEKLVEIRRKDQALLQQNKMAAIGETIGAIAHQWRQPLNSLGLNIQMLIDMAEDKKCSIEEVEEFVDKNMQTIQFMSKTIDDFRNFFRDSREKIEFDIKDAIESTILLQKEQLKNNNIELKVDFEPIKIVGYKNKFMQVILNLISNAKDAIESKKEIQKDLKGYIKLTSKKDKKYAIIEIEDNGIEVPSKLTDKIFEPYFTTKEQGKGTGMGLYMSKEIISSMDGNISLVSDDKQKKFVIRFKG